MSKFEIKLGNATYPLVISDKENRCLEVTFAEGTYTFGAKLREVQEYGSSFVVNLVYDQQLETLADSLVDVVAWLGFSPSLVSARRVNKDTVKELLYYGAYVVVLQADPSELDDAVIDALNVVGGSEEQVVYMGTTADAPYAFRIALWELFDLIDSVLLAY